MVYIRTVSGWDAEAYDPSVSKEDAIAHLADELGLSDPLALDWELGLDTGDMTGLTPTRAPFGKGFFVSDPLYAAAAAMDDPEPLAALVETMGGASASSAVNTSTITPVGDPIPGGGGGCEPTGGCLIAPQDSIAIGIDAMLDGTASNMIEAEAVANDHNLAISCCCVRWTWYNWWVGPWTAWDCVGGTGWTYTRRVAISPGQDNCYFKRQVGRSQQRRVVRRCWNCNYVQQLQTRTHYDWQESVGGPVLRQDPCTTGPNQPWPACSAGPNAIPAAPVPSWPPVSLPPC